MRALLFLWVVLCGTQGFAAFNLTWGTPAVNLDSNPPAGDTDANASIAIDPYGNAVATWSRTTGKRVTEDVWAALYNHSSRVWTGAVKISGGGSASNSRVAIDQKGNALLIWEEGFPSQIYSRTLSAKGVWTPPLSQPPIAVHASGVPQITPQIVIDLEGNAVAIWAELSAGQYHIHSAKKEIKNSWIYLGKISSGLRTAGLNLNKSIKMNEAGDAIAVWEELQGKHLEVHGALYCKGAWQDPFPIATPSGKNAQSPAAGIDAMGRAVIVWSEEDTIRSKTLDKTTLSEVVILSNPAYIAQRPDLGVDAAGNAVVVFERYDAMHKFIAASARPFNSASWTPPLDLSGPSPSSSAGAGYPVLALNAIGDGVVIWKEFTGTHMIIQSAGYALGTWSFVKTLSSFDDNAGAPFPAYDVGVAVNTTGNILAIWPEDPSKVGARQIKATGGLKPPIEAIAAAPFQPPVDAPKAPPTELAKGEPMPPVEQPKEVIVAAEPTQPIEELKTETEVAVAAEPAPPNVQAEIAVAAEPIPVQQELPPEPLTDIATAPEVPPTETLGIKVVAGVGLANIGSLPPQLVPESIQQGGVAFGSQRLRRFPAHADLINTLTWNAQPNAIRYNIYRGSFTNLIATTTAPFFEDHQRIPKKREIYLITAVDRNEQESSPITLVVEPMGK